MSNAETASGATSGILIEAEDFDNYGGWVLDSQFETQMGSPYLLAHGLGRPVADATTVVRIPSAGEYDVWVRAKDWGGRPSGVKTHGSVLDAMLRVALAFWRRPVAKERLKAKLTIAHPQDLLDGAVAQHPRQGQDIGGDIMQLLVLRGHPVQCVCLGC